MAIWKSKPTDLERLEQSKKAKGDVSSKAMYEAGTYEWITTGVTGTTTTYPGLYVGEASVPSPVRPPMTIPISFFPESLIHKLMQESFKDGASAEEILLGFAHGLMAHIEVTYDGDFRLRIKE